mgnify:CR=1 FL=1
MTEPKNYGIAYMCERFTLLLLAKAAAEFNSLGLMSLEIFFLSHSNKAWKFFSLTKDERLYEILPRK